uniref:NADAR domain-containing protein n=1 Tax=Panagrellus redivivus TaxID=6233 RepID=A0A7E4UMZ0_PANRE
MDPGELDQAKIVLINDEEDVLHCGYAFTLKHEGKRFPSVLHFAYSQVLAQMRLPEEDILDLLSTPCLEVPARAFKLIKDTLPPGRDIIQMTPYITNLRQNFLLTGLRIRSEQDETFKNNLVATSDTLLIVCDEKDPELGVGMSDKSLVEFWRVGGYKMQDLSDWMLDERSRPKAIGQNLLGFVLMWLRHELREKERLKLLTNVEVSFPGLSTESDKAAMMVTANTQLLSLSGILKPLSNYYRFSFDVKDESYRSVEHYAFERLFDTLKIDEPYIQKLRSVHQPADVARVAKKVLAELEFDESELKHKMAKLDRWRQTAMKHKISKDQELQQLLLNTGNAFLIETNPYGDDVWTVNTDEYELQHLLTKPNIDVTYLADIMCGREKPPPSLEHIGRNKTGILLMELRQKYANAAFVPFAFIAPPDTNIQRLGPSNNIICFTPESIFHPFYPVAIVVSPTLTVPSPIHFVVLYACRFLSIKPALEEEILNIREPSECWYEFNRQLQTELNIPFQKLQSYFMMERQRLLKIALSLMLNQHSAILRALLETEDALLVCCSRFNTIEAELTSGLREREFRRVFQESQSDVKELIEFFLKPQPNRPPYVGGNRLGFILMELRRHFTLGGCYPSQYDLLPMTVEAKLGTDSPTENYVCDRPFTALTKMNYTSVWADPYILTFKTDPNFVNIRRSYPVYVRNEPTRSTAYVQAVKNEDLDLAKDIKINGPGLALGAAATAVTDIFDMLVLEERKAIACRHERECTVAVQDELREWQDRSKPKPPPSAVHQPPQMPPPMNNPPPLISSGPSLLAGPSDNGFQMPGSSGGPPRFGGNFPPNRPPPGNVGPPNPFYNRQPPQHHNDYRHGGGDHNRYNSPRNDRNRRNYGSSGGRDMQRNNYSGPPQRNDRHGGRDGPNYNNGGNYRNGYRRDGNQLSGSGTPKSTPAPPPRTASPKPKKPKRVVDESELSEGEILSSDED